MQPAPATPPPDPRVLGVVEGDGPGPTTVLVGAIHGNEPAGTMAIQRVLDAVASRGGGIRGRVIGIVGNAGALDRRARYLDEDLNRIWESDRIAAVRRGEAVSTAEGPEQAALVGLFDRLAADGDGPLTVVDLHTASAAAPPFTVAAGSDRAAAIADAIPAPTVTGLERHLRGLLLTWLAGEGHGAVVFEAGEHTAVESVGLHAAAIRLVLAAAGHVEPDPHRRQDDLRVLRDASRGLPERLEIVHRHPTEPDDDFMMLPGFSTFDRVERGRLLATDRRGDVRAPTGGRLLLPRYQRWGSDGFFIGR